MSAPIALIRLESASWLNENSNAGSLAGSGFRGNTQSVRQRGYFGGRQVQQRWINLIGRRQRATVRFAKLQNQVSKNNLLEQTLKQTASHPSQKPAIVQLVSADVASSNRASKTTRSRNKIFAR